MKKGIGKWIALVIALLFLAYGLFSVGFNYGYISGVVDVVKEQTTSDNIYLSDASSQIQNYPIETICANIAGAGQ